ncbi:MAG: TlpA family protein disulfide reductase [Saprospiraceae bacterium]
MKPIQFLLLTLFLLSNIVTLHGRELHIDIQIHLTAGQVQNATPSEITFSYTEDALLETEKNYKIPVKADGKIYTILNIPTISILKITYQNQTFETYIKGLNKLNCVFDGENLQETLTFKGQLSQENQILQESNSHSFSEKTTFNKGFIFIKSTKKNAQSAAASASFLEYKKNIFKPKKITDKNLNSDFVKYINHKNTYEYWTNLNIYSIKKNAIDANQNDFLKDLSIENDQLLEETFYTNFIQSYIYYLYLKGKGGETKAKFAMYKIASKHLHDETKDWFLAKILINAHKEQFPDLATQKFYQFKRSSLYPNYTKAVEQFYGDALTFDSKGSAPLFTLKDDNNKQVSLADFKGKVVYISFWASWCGPCLANFTKSEGIRNQMMDKGVVLVNICLDSNESTWRRTMFRIPMPGINLYASADTPLKLQYDLSRLPAYYIVDKNGNFTYLPDGQRDILYEFEQLVKE